MQESPAWLYLVAMLDVSPSGLCKEARYAEDRREPFIGPMVEEMVRTTAGPGFRRDWDAPGQRENFGQQWVSLFAPLLLSGNPRCRIRSSRTGPGAQAVAKGLQAELNQSVVEQDMKRLNELLFTDWAYGTTICFTSSAPIPGFEDLEDRPERPNTQRLPREHYLHDSLAYEASKDRWRAHLNLRDRSDLAAEARRHPEMGWNLELIQNLDVDSGLDRTLRGDYWSDSGGGGGPIKRHEIAYLEIWVREHVLPRARGEDGRWFRPSRENGHNGTVFTVPWGQYKGGSWPGEEVERLRIADEQGYLRKPYPFFGPPEGPYDVDGAIIIRNQSEFLGPVPAAKRQVDDLNDVADALQGAIRAFKRGVAVGAIAGDDIAEVLAEFQDTGVFRVSAAAEDIKKAVLEMQVGGPAPELFQAFVHDQESVARNTGLDDAQQGQADPEATATAVTIAARSSGRRAGWMRQKFVSYLEGILRKHAWYYFEKAKRNWERLALGLRPEPQQIVDPLTGEVTEIPLTVVDAGDPPLQFDDFELTIELFSLAMTSEEQIQTQAQGRLAFYTQVAPMIPQLSMFIDCKQAFEEYGEMMGDPGLTRPIDFRMAAALGQLQLQMGIPPPQPMATPQPRVLMGGGAPAPGIGGGARAQGQGSQTASFGMNGGSRQSRAVQPLGG